MSDSWYSRPVRPHYYRGDTYSSEEVKQEAMTEDEVKEYKAGYAFNEHLGGKKDYGYRD
jgi:hypothetical protein